MQEKLYRTKEKWGRVNYQHILETTDFYFVKEFVLLDVCGMRFNGFYSL